MRNKLVVLVDLGCLKAYRVAYDGLSSTPQMELLDNFETIDVHERFNDLVSDEAGRFHGGNSMVKGPRVSGERHNMKLEVERRSIRELARNVTALIKNVGEEVECYLAASKEIHHPLLDELEPSVRARIIRNVPEDLTHVDKGELLEHFKPLF